MCLTFPPKGRRSRSRSPDSRGSTPIQDHGDKDYRYGVDISSQPPSLSSIVNIPPHSENYRPRPPPRPRCRDFDGKFQIMMILKEEPPCVETCGNSFYFSEG